MNASSPTDFTATAPNCSLEEEVASLRNELKREQDKYCEIKSMYQALNEFNGHCLELNIQLEEAVGKLLRSLSLPTDTLYRPELTDYHTLIQFIDNESPRLKSLMRGLDLLASLAVGLNATVEMHKSEIKALREEVCRLRSEGAGETTGSTNDLDNSGFFSRSHSPALATCENLQIVPLAKVSSKSMPECQSGEVKQKADMNSKSSHTESKKSVPIRECQTPDVQQNADANDKSRYIESKDSVSTSKVGSLPGNSSLPNPLAFEILLHKVSDGFALKRGEVNCAINVDGHGLAGTTFNWPAGWQIYFNFVSGPGQRRVSLHFRYMPGGDSTHRGHEKAKRFTLIWELFQDTSFVVKEVKPYEPASLRDLPLALSGLHTEQRDPGKLWQVTLVGTFDSPPDYSHRILKDLDECIKINLKALFKPGSTKQIGIWFFNPEKSGRRKPKQDMCALKAMQSVE